jgi:AraC-like DNA-binding protein
MTLRWYACPSMRHIVARPRCPALAPFIKAFHYHESDLAPVVERILPNGQAHLMVNLAEGEFRTYSGERCESVHRTRGAVLAGPHGKATAIDTMEQRHLIAVEFKLGGAAAFFGMPLSEVCDKIVGLDDVWGYDGAFVRERLCEPPTPGEKLRVLETILLERFTRSSEPGTTTAVQLLARGVSLTDTRSRLGLLPKTFVRRIREQAGLTPKRLWRVRRMQRLVGSVRCPADADWCQVAAQYGYTDQAHFIHDFRDLTGMTPTAYRPAAPQRRNHVPVVALGS